MNVAVISGRLGKDPELKYTQNNIPVVTTSIAINEYTKDENAKANWQNIKVWRGTAEFLYNNCKKGDLITVSGELKNDSWDKDGITQYYNYINVQSLEIGQKSTNKSVSTSSVKVKDIPAEEYESKDEDLPF